jgi:hypothetical protein
LDSLGTCREVIFIFITLERKREKMSFLRQFGSKPQPSVINLAMWGPPQSGKTVYLTISATLGESQSWTLLPAKEETSDYIIETSGYIFEQKTVPPPTPKLAPIIHRFTLRNNDRRNTEYVVEIPDAPGEIYANPESALFNMVVYLATCHGIIWLLDPVALKERQLYEYPGGTRSYRQMISHTLARLYQKYGSVGKIDKPMAFVLTKMDLPDHVEYFDSPQDYALQLLGATFERDIERYCMLDRVEFFSISALGFADSKKITSNLNISDTGDPILRTIHIHPVGIMDPIEWLLAKIL